MKQKTLKREVSFDGVGVHLGQPCKVVLKPAEPNSGITFVNSRFISESIKLGCVVPEEAMHASVIKNSRWMVSTVEHLMATIGSFGIDNLIVEIEGVEIPILDGSAIAFVHKFEQVGILEQDSKKTFLTPKQTLKFEDKDGRLIQIEPAKFCKNLTDRDQNLYFDYVADFSHPLVGQSSLKGVFSLDYFSKQIAPARTFGFLEQLPFLRRHGLAKGTTLGNTVVIGEEEFLNDRRFEDEFVRHKFLDLIGDLALLGKSLAGTIKARKTGHNFNRFVVEHYVKNPEQWQCFST